jgi:hypothetical protein
MQLWRRQFNNNSLWWLLEAKKNIHNHVMELRNAIKVYGWLSPVRLYSTRCFTAVNFPIRIFLFPPQYIKQIATCSTMAVSLSHHLKLNKWWLTIKLRDKSFHKLFFRFSSSSFQLMFHLFPITLDNLSEKDVGDGVLKRRRGWKPRCGKGIKADITLIKLFPKETTNDLCDMH